MKLILIISIVFLFFFTSCSTQFPKYSNLKIDEIDAVYIHHLPSEVELIYKLNKRKIDKDLSDSLDYITKKLIYENIPANIKYDSIINIGGELNTKIESEIKNLVSLINIKNSIKKVPIPLNLYDFYNAYGAKYVIINHSYGFTRTKNNKAANLLMDIGLGVISKGQHNDYSKKAYTNIFSMVIDVRNNKIVFFQHFRGELEPLKYKWISRIIKEQLLNFFNYIPNNSP